MTDQANTTTLWRPVGRDELKLIEQTGWTAFPARLPEQPIFYPVVTFEYAERIARDWNSTDHGHSQLGYVTEFDVLNSFLDAYNRHEVGSRKHIEYWIPAEELPKFNDAIIGEIRVTAEYRNGVRVDR